MGKSVSKAMTFEDNLSSKELVGLFGSSVRSKAVSGRNVSKYMVSVKNASTGLILAQLAIRSTKFVQRHQSAIVILVAIAGWFLAFSGWLAK